MRIINKLIFFGLIILIGISAVFFILKQPEIKTPLLLVKNHAPIYLEVAKTGKEQEIGLMYRTSMPDNHGMIFIFEKPAILKFWMKNTLIPLDMIFLNHHQIVAIFFGVPPCKSKNNDCPTYGPDTETDTVIEVNAEIAKQLKLSVGDALEFKINTELTQ